MRARMQTLEGGFFARTIAGTSRMTVVDKEDDDVTIRTAIPLEISSGSEIAQAIRHRFEDELARSRVYRRVQHDDCDNSFTSSALRSHAWSIFTGLSLSDISAISVIALPLSQKELAQLPWHPWITGSILLSVQQDQYASFDIEAANETFTVCDLKIKIEQHTGITRDQQQICFRERLLGNDVYTLQQTLRQIGIHGARCVIKLANRHSMRFLETKVTV